MGIDARMLVIVTGPPPTPAQIKLWSARLARELGQENFFQVRDEGRGALTLSNVYDEDISQHGRVYSQDGPDLVAGQDETFLEIHLWTRYYGPGYERGNWMVICAAAEWAEINIPGSRVLYGGDSSGVQLEPFGEAERKALRLHAMGLHARDYFKPYKSEDQNPFPIQLVQECKLCVLEYYQPVRYGFGAGYAAYSCAVCGEQRVTRDNGVTWTDKPEGDF